MSVISDSIESFIKDMMEDIDGAYELKRNELAERFGCAPSQINYVLQTRFTPERGYVIESRRGGGGCIKLYRVNIDKHEVVKSLLEDFTKKGAMSEKNARQMLSDLASLGIIDIRTARLIYFAVSDDALSAAGPKKDALRVNILKTMMTAVLAEQ